MRHTKQGSLHMGIFWVGVTSVVKMTVNSTGSSKQSPG